MDQVILDCTTGETHHSPMTPDEVALHQRLQADAQQEAEARQAVQAAAEEQRQADAQTVLSVVPSQGAKDALTRLLNLA